MLIKMWSSPRQQQIDINFNPSNPFMATFIIWQKPYGQTAEITLLTEHKRIFCPYYHSKPGHFNFPATAVQRRQYYISQGWISPTAEYINKCHSYFMELVPGTQVIVPHRSYSGSADKNLGYLLKICDGHSYETINGLTSLFLKVDIIDAAVHIPSGVRQSIVKLTQI